MATPSNKSEPIEKFLEEMFGRTTAIESNTCVTCGQDASHFRNKISHKEYMYSGMCQECQDSVFGVD